MRGCIGGSSGSCRWPDFRRARVAPNAARLPVLVAGGGTRVPWRRRQCRISAARAENCLNAKGAKGARGREGGPLGLASPGMDASFALTAENSINAEDAEGAEDRRGRATRLKGVREKAHPTWRATLLGRLFPLSVAVAVRSPPRTSASSASSASRLLPRNSFVTFVTFVPFVLMLLPRHQLRGLRVKAVAEPQLIAGIRRFRGPR